MAALGAAVELLELIGIREVGARVQALAGHAKQALAALANVELKTNLEPELSGGVVKFRLKDMPDGAGLRPALGAAPAGDRDDARGRFGRAAVLAPYLQHLRGDRPRRGRRARADRVNASPW